MNKIELILTGLIVIIDVIVISALGMGISVNIFWRQLSIFGSGVILGLVSWYLFIEPSVKEKRNGKS